MRKEELPRPCGKCSTTDWPYQANGGVDRCTCARGRALAQAALSRGRRRNDVSGVESVLVSLAVEDLAALMPHYGALASDVARLAVARQLQEFVCDPEELAWLVREAPLRYPAWPGIREIRALYCARFSPRDGVVVDSWVYEGGIIPGVVDPPHLIADGRHGALISANAGDALMVRMLADAMPPQRRRASLRNRPRRNQSFPPRKRSTASRKSSGRIRNAIRPVESRRVTRHKQRIDQACSAGPGDAHQPLGGDTVPRADG